MGAAFLGKISTTSTIMKSLAALLAVVLVSGAIGMTVPKGRPVSSGRRYYVSQVVQKPPRGFDVGVDKCNLCVNVMGQVIDNVLNIILQGGVVGGCSDLCQKVTNGNQALDVACSLLCDIVGVDEFMKLVEEADLDVIYYCELLGGTCPVKDDGDAKITALTVTPKSGPQGTFDIGFAYHSNNGTGTGEIVLEVETLDGIPVGSSFLHELAAAGDYNSTFKLKAEPDPQCDPTQEPCEQWLPGQYTVKIAICNGECGSQHPHSQIYDEASASFNITGTIRH